MAFSIATFIIMTLSIMIFNITTPSLMAFSMMVLFVTLGVSVKCHYVECHYAERRGTKVPSFRAVWHYISILNFEIKYILILTNVFEILT